MLTRYRFMRETIGLSQAEAADNVHKGVRHDSVKAWDSGKNPAPPGVIVELQELQRRIDEASGDLERLLMAIAAPGGRRPKDPIAVAIGVPATPEDAEAAGYPSHQSMMRAIGRAVLRLPPWVAPEFVRTGDADAVEIPALLMPLTGPH